MIYSGRFTEFITWFYLSPFIFCPYFTAHLKTQVLVYGAPMDLLPDA